MSEKKDFLFRFVDQNIRRDLLFDDEALYSTTDQLTADKITRDILRFVPRSGIIVDGTACIGGNTYSFAQCVRKVIAYELDPTRALYLAHNMKCLGMTNVECVVGDVLDKLPSLSLPIDCIFLDPPWGGPEYKNHERIQLMLSEHSLGAACKRLASQTTYIALKVPTNFDESTFQKECDGMLTCVLRNTQLRKMHLLIYKVGHHPSN
jgi:16S rRNA G966 N2-methylase RsmD